MIFDTHAHYDDDAFKEDREVLLKGLLEQGIEAVVDVGTTRASSELALRLAADFPQVYAAIGFHPEELSSIAETDWDWLEKTAQKERISNGRVVAVGEIGLDYYWDKEHHEEQRDVFSRQLAIAEKTKLPVIVHSREAARDTMDTLKAAHAERIGGVIHCYSGSVEMAEEYVKMGFFLGVGGVVTYKNGKTLKAVVERIPIESLVVETDCPYLAPVPVRGKRNSSLNLPFVIQEIARLKGMTPEEVEVETTKNAKRLYRLEVSNG